MRIYGKQFWRSVPFLRLLVPLTAGILAEQYKLIPIVILINLAILSATVIAAFQFLPIYKKYSVRWIQGTAINLIFLCLGAVLIYYQDLTHDAKWIGHEISGKETLLLTLQEPLSEKNNSYKTIARAESIYRNNGWKTVKGNILLYFKKDGTAPLLDYGSQIIVSAQLQPIANSGNPGGFNYRRYCAFQGIHYQLYLRPEEYHLLPALQSNWLTHTLIQTRARVLSIFKQRVPGKKETGVAEALLIGYRDDLDKGLVQAYSNTGVVHIIAISGLHLGMIYGLIMLLLKPFRKLRWIRWAKPLIILLVLWGFSLLAGAAASILRSAVMFSFIAIGECLNRKTNIYNTLAASAFCLLVYNPYFFWDLGFQLSYTAVLSIILFMKPIYRLLYTPNKILNAIWQLNAVTLSAQVLTLPLILYYFHQFPNLFLITNSIAVPLSGFILYGELVLLAVSPFPFLAKYTGMAISFLIKCMNGFIENTNQLPYSVTGQIHTSLVQTILLYLALSYGAYWLLQKKTASLITALFFTAGFSSVYCLTQLTEKQQHKLIIYNIPHHTAIDIIEGQYYRFICDTVFPPNSQTRNFHLNPARSGYGLASEKTLKYTILQQEMIRSRKKTILLITQPPSGKPPGGKIPVDIIVLAGNPAIYLSQLAAVFDCKQYVFDSSNPLWKIQYWKKDADNLHLRHHSIPEQGALELDL